MPTFLHLLFTEFLILSQGGKFLKIINASFILKLKKKKLFPSAVGIKFAAGKEKLDFPFCFHPFSSNHLQVLSE